MLGYHLVAQLMGRNNGTDNGTKSYTSIQWIR